MSKAKIFKDLCEFDRDLFWLRSVVSSVKKSSLPEVRSCLPALLSALERLESVTLDKYITEESKHE